MKMVLPKLGSSLSTPKKEGHSGPCHSATPSSQKGSQAFLSTRCAPRRLKSVAETTKMETYYLSAKSGITLAIFDAHLTPTHPPSFRNHPPLPQYHSTAYSKIFFGPPVVLTTPVSPQKRYVAFTISTFMFTDPYFRLSHAFFSALEPAALSLFG